MKCHSVGFEHFRNLTEQTVSFSDGVNVLYGENAQGKTNVLEGICLFSRGKSFRASKDRETIAFGHDTARVFLSMENQSAQHLLGVEIHDVKPKRFYRDRVPIAHTADVIGEFQSVFFCPEHLGLVKDAPAGRRRFLDIAIAQIRPVYMRALIRYNNILKERNALIKNAQNGCAYTVDAMLDLFSAQLADACVEIAAMRREYIAGLDECAKAFFREMTGEKEAPRLTYLTEAPEGDDPARARAHYISLLTENIEREIRYGATLFGIHRDDVGIYLNDKEAKLYASQGQQRSLVLAMKLAEGKLCRDASGEWPVFLLDDVLSELDATRQAYILSELNDRQVIVTTCEPSVFGGVNGAKMIRVEQGRTSDVS